LAGCAGSGCPAGFTPATVAELYFGIGQGAPKPTGKPSIVKLDAAQDATWLSFLDDTVTPLFPSGLTVLTAVGQWREAPDRIIREPVRVLRLVLPGTDRREAAGRVAPLVEIGKRQLRQTNVLVTLDASCTAL